MRALICRQWGGLEQLQVGEAPVPRPGRGEVLIAVQAIAVNYADSIMVAGQYQTRPELPFSPGLETAGVVAACGPGVHALRSRRSRDGHPRPRRPRRDGRGRRPRHVRRFPPAWASTRRARFPIAYISSHVALRWKGRLEAGETLLVLGAARRRRPHRGRDRQGDGRARHRGGEHGGQAGGGPRARRRRHDELHDREADRAA